MIKEINFSNEAVEKINQLIAKKPSGTYFRIAVKGGGCSGFKYDFSFDNKIANDDLKHENILIDKSCKFVTGTTDKAGVSSPDLLNIFCHISLKLIGLTDPEGSVGMLLLL